MRGGTRMRTQTYASPRLLLGTLPGWTVPSPHIRVPWGEYSKKTIDLFRNEAGFASPEASSTEICLS